MAGTSTTPVSDLSSQSGLSEVDTVHLNDLTRSLQDFKEEEEEHPSPSTKSASERPSDLSITVRNRIRVGDYSAKPEDIFTLFPKLPKELQNKIWEDAAQNLYSRLVTIEPGGSPPPGLFHASYDSRTTALKNYNRHIYLGYQDRSFGQMFPIIVDYDMDFAFIEDPGKSVPVRDLCVMLRRVMGCNASRYVSFKYMVIDVQFFTDDSNMEKNVEAPHWWRFGAFWIALEKYCPSLRRVIFVCNAREGRDLYDLFERQQSPVLEKIFDIGSQHLAHIQSQGFLENVEMNVMEWDDWMED